MKVHGETPKNTPLKQALSKKRPEALYSIKHFSEFTAYNPSCGQYSPILFIEAVELFEKRPSVINILKALLHFASETGKGYHSPSWPVVVYVAYW